MRKVQVRLSPMGDPRATACSIYKFKEKRTGPTISTSEKLGPLDIDSDIRTSQKLLIPAPIFGRRGRQWIYGEGGAVQFVPVQAGISNKTSKAGALVHAHIFKYRID